jgi:hypothetical protein
MTWPADLLELLGTYTGLSGSLQSSTLQHHGFVQAVQTIADLQGQIL